MTKPPTLKDKFLNDVVKRLQLDNQLFTERMKILEKRLDFMQDDVARVAIEEQALITSLKVINDIAHSLLDKRGIPSNPKDTGDAMTQHYQ